MDIEKFKSKIEYFNIESKAKNSLRSALENYKHENFEEYKKYFNGEEADKLYIAVSTISLKLGNWPECNYNHIVVQMPIWYDRSHIGEYLVMFSLDGEIDDDILNIFQ